MSVKITLAYLDPKGRAVTITRSNADDFTPSIEAEETGVAFTDHTEARDRRTLVPWHRVLSLTTDRTLTADERRLRLDAALRGPAR